jgi:hypothetical protein
MLSFRPELVEVMRRQVWLAPGCKHSRQLTRFVNQLDCVRDSEMEKEIEDDVLRCMIQENIQWMSKTSGIAVLLPYG